MSNNTIQIFNPFVDLQSQPLQPPTQNLENLTALSVGSGSRALRADKSGFWMGAEAWADAKVRFDMDGNAYIAGTFSLTLNDLDDIVDGTTYSRVLTTSISAGLIVLSETIGTLDDVVDGGTYARVLKTTISSGHILLDETISGVYGKVASTDITAGHIKLDETINGTYGKVLSTDISAGHIILSNVSGDLDDVDDGTTFKKVTANEKTGAGRGYSGLNSSYQIIKGFVESQLSSVSLPTNGIRIDVNGIYARKSGVTTVYISNVGDAYFSGTVAASVILGSTLQTGSTGENVNITESKIELRSGSTVTGVLRGDDSVFTSYLEVSHMKALGPGGSVEIRATSGVGPAIITSGGLSIDPNGGWVGIDSPNNSQQIYLYHNNTHGYLKTTTGNLYLDPNSGRAGGMEVLFFAGMDGTLNFTADGQIAMWTNGSLDRCYSRLAGANVIMGEA
ncbi:MAG: hypothetical protein COY66_05030 [Candidatus Kerfeldbacteria bacterium CG_4_10_14_0_8_um_filter_42_10]|uniref:Uncharacterized protein n=1 Tax=Candidatus Kerfeldbacteria bacterium CG_4_10_14_0_8_um_filter_42_10 TaxID=2014248 RepID=A0A2M7RH51_9BACT|nr:MAG: hypothetical protein COY66_05030 [Candidatus Kerfeldbacteria bacterium CG_4_10_14_0_8_um_filter_42_10]